MVWAACFEAVGNNWGLLRFEAIHNQSSTQGQQDTEI